jgi:predicted CXXCH cytochrome family protein
MRKKNIWLLILGGSLIIWLGKSPLLSQESSCLKCHLKLEDELARPALNFQLDIHQEKGLDCSDCHGGNPQAEDMDEAKDFSFKGAPARRDIPQFCAACHSNIKYMRQYNPSLRVDQYTLYLTSRHGQLFQKGDSRTAVCTDCHQAHGILNARQPKSSTFPWNIPETCGRCHSDPKYMKPYRISTNQVDDYKQSVHAEALYTKKDLSAPVCNDCHGNHGATPPEVASIANVCRQCHPGTAELFAQSIHKPAFDELGLAECEACHGNHKISKPDDRMLGREKGSVCLHCHEEGTEALNLSQKIKQEISSLAQKIAAAAELLAQAEDKGIEVSNSKFKLSQASTILIQTRNLTHSLDLEKISTKTSEGWKIAEEVEKEGLLALKEAKERRIGLIITTLFILIFALSLILRIRERKASS